MPHITDAELLSRLSQCPARGTLWRHRGGALVRVVVCSIHEATGLPMVTYAHEDDRPAEERVIWTRLLDIFRERFQPEPAAARDA